MEVGANESSILVFDNCCCLLFMACDFLHHNEAYTKTVGDIAEQKGGEVYGRRCDFYPIGMHNNCNFIPLGGILLKMMKRIFNIINYEEKESESKEKEE